jgi:hypothetical protein
MFSGHSGAKNGRLKQISRENAVQNSALGSTLLFRQILISIGLSLLGDKQTTRQWSGHHKKEVRRGAMNPQIETKMQEEGQNGQNDKQGHAAAAQGVSGVKTRPSPTPLSGFTFLPFFSKKNDKRANLFAFWEFSQTDRPGCLNPHVDPESTPHLLSSAQLGAFFSAGTCRETAHKHLTVHKPQCSDATSTGTTPQTYSSWTM